MNLYFTVFTRPCQSSLRFQIKLFLAVADKCSFQSVFCLTPCLFKITLFEPTCRAYKLFCRNCFLDGENRNKFLNFQTQLFLGLPNCLPGLTGNNCNGLTHIFNYTFRQKTFILNDRSIKIMTRNISMCKNSRNTVQLGQFFRIEIYNFAMGNRTSYKINNQLIFREW